MDDASARPDALDRAFRIGIALKGLNGALELIGGIVLLVASPAAINRFVVAVTREELSEDPHDLIARSLLHTARGLSGHAVVFGSVYLLSHAIVKLALVAALLKNKLWAYPWMVAFLLVFIGYQLYRSMIDPAVGMIGLTVFDAVIAWLTVREYRRQRLLRRA